MNLVHNEQAKLTATYLNGLAIATFAVGGLAPLFSALNAGTPGPLPFWAVASISLVCALTSLSLHLIARLVLRRMKE
jgi:hypothetical protein